MRKTLTGCVIIFSLIALFSVLKSSSFRLKFVSWTGTRVNQKNISQTTSTVDMHARDFARQAGVNIPSSEPALIHQNTLSSKTWHAAYVMDKKSRPYYVMVNIDFLGDKVKGEVSIADK